MADSLHIPHYSDEDSFVIDNISDKGKQLRFVVRSEVLTQPKGSKFTPNSIAVSLSEKGVRVSTHTVKSQMRVLVDEGKVRRSGGHYWVRYGLVAKPNSALRYSSSSK